MTGSDGTFEFTSLPVGQVFVMARKPGFFNDQELRQGASPWFLTATDVTGPVVVKLTPQALLTGHITDSSGEPIENIPVEPALPLDSGRQFKNGCVTIRPQQMKMVSFACRD